MTDAHLINASLRNSQNKSYTFIDNQREFVIES